MSDLPTPITREEHFLNGIAQGDTSNLPTPVGREEKYLDYIARNGGGGGGGGTTNYNALDNKPQIAGTTLQGNKSLADLGIASASDVETALGGKVDKVEGKGLSTNDYDNTEKAEVAKVAGKAEKTATASGEALALAPTSEGKALLHTAYGMSVQNGTPTPSVPVDIESAKVNLRSVGKNLNSYPYTGVSTAGGITWTDNGDGTVTADNTATVTSYFSCHNRVVTSINQLIVPNGRYIISGCPDGGGDTTYQIRVGITKNGAFQQLAVCNNSSENVEFTVNGDDSFIDKARLQISLVIVKGASVSNLVFKPMLRFADVADSAFESYKKTDTTTDLTLRAIEVSSTDNYNLVRDNKYYIADTLDYSEDSGFVVTRRIQEVTLDISTFIWSGANTFIYLSNTGFMGAGDDDKAPIICNYLPTEDRNNLRDDVKTGIGCRIGGPSTLIINILTYTTLEDYTTWASGKTIKVVGALATPTTENITTEQALALLSLKTYDESTSISSQAEPSCTVAIEYAKERLGALTLIAHNLAKGNDLRIAELEETP